MDSDHALVLFLALVLVGTAVALAYASPLVFGEDGDEDGVTDATLASFETTEAYCGDPETISGSSVTHDVPRGEALVINQTLPLPTNDTEVNASVDEFGPQRFILEVIRETNETGADGETPTPTPEPEQTERGTPLDGATEATETTTTDESDEECHPEVRYNATIVIEQPQEYTVLVTYDDELVNVYWRDGDDGGSYGRLPDTPRGTERDNGTATGEDARLAPAEP